MLDKIKCFFAGHIPIEKIDKNVLIASGQNISGQLGINKNKKSTISYSYRTTRTTICKRCCKLIDWNVI